MGELGQQHKSTQQHGGFIRSFFSYTCYQESLEGSRVTKSVTVLISVFTECFLRDNNREILNIEELRRLNAQSILGNGTMPSNFPLTVVNKFCR